MAYNATAPFAHGMEIEQCRDELPHPLNGDCETARDMGFSDHHRDGSGPMEWTMPAYKSPGYLLRRFYKDTRDDDDVGAWTWTAQTSAERGCGSHVHLHMEEPDEDDEAAGLTTAERWTIAWNTAVEVLPLLAPFFCHNWQRGFRGGAARHGSTAVNQWAEGQTRRYAPDSMEANVEMPHEPTRGYDSVTLSGAEGGKPLTMEFRLNDAHPGMAVVGMLVFRRIVKQCVARGSSPKLRDRAATLSQMYRAIYDEPAGTSRGLIEAMQASTDLEFEEGRGIPTTPVHDRELEEADSMWEALAWTIRHLLRDNKGTYRRRARELVLHAGEEGSTHGPQNNGDALWSMDADQGEFEWARGPEPSAHE